MFIFDSFDRDVFGRREKFVNDCVEPKDPHDKL